MHSCAIVDSISSYFSLMHNQLTQSDVHHLTEILCWLEAKIVRIE